VFYAVGSGQRAVVIELEQEKFRRLIVEPSGGEAPERCAARVYEAASAARARAPHN
jgi:hypothetical protein